MKSVLLAGRILFGILFVFTAFASLSGQTTPYAAAAGVPAAAVLVPLGGLIELLGGLSVLVGFKAKWGAWLLVTFLLPVTLYLHAFWSITDPMQKMVQMADFIKNFSLIGGALIITWFGSGPLSIDNVLANRGGKKAMAI